MKKILSYFAANRIVSVLILVSALALMIYPRFNRNDIPLVQAFSGLGKGEFSIDQKNYMLFAEYFRGNAQLSEVAVPYSYRPLAPFLVAAFPFPTGLSFTIFNIIVLIISSVIVFLVLRKLLFAFGYAVTGSLLFIVAFPLLYYSCMGNIDPMSIMFIAAIVLCRLYKKDFLLPLLFFFAALAKETTIIAFGYLAMYALTERENRRTYLFYLALSFVTYIAAVYYARVTFGTSSGYSWLPAIKTIMENLPRPKTYLSFIISFGFPGVLTLFYLFRNYKNDLWEHKKPLLMGFLGAMALWGYSFIAAYSDGRFVWAAYPFMVPLAVRYLFLRYGNKP